MRIQLIHPPHPAAIEDRLDAPLGLLYVASVAAEAGHDVTIADLSGQRKEDWEIGDADIYGITSYIPTVALSAEIARLCREQNPHAIIVGGGANFTDLVKSRLTQYIPNEFDSIIVGPGELAMQDLIADMPNIKPYYEHPLDRDLDSMPNPDYGLVDLKSYNRKIGDRRSLSILTSRGCPFGCAFCSIGNQYKTVKYRSPEAVAKEIRQIIDTYGIRSFNFQDDTFLTDKRRTHQLLSLLEPFGINFRCHGRIGLDTKEDYVRLKRAGCSQICWGIESGSQFILDRMKKNVTVGQCKETISCVQELDILDRAFFIVGFPGESAETLEKTKEFIKEANPSQCFVSTFQPYPGTDVWRHPARYGISWIYKDFSRYIQIQGVNQGGSCNIDTIWASHEEMEKLECEFRNWIFRHKSRGSLQDYEQKIEMRAVNIYGI